MDEQIIDAALKLHLGEISERLDQAASIAKAAKPAPPPAMQIRP